MSGVADVVVELALGAATTDVSPTWTDITTRVRLQDRIGIRRGRRDDGRQIRPGTAVLVVDNVADPITGHPFDPENTAGPFYPDLVDRTPIRISMDVGGTVETLYRGVVEAWPQIDTAEDDVVSLDLLDTSALIAQSDAPGTAWEVQVRREAETFTLEHWWTPGPSGWMDRVTKLSARHSGGLVEVSPSSASDGMSTVVSGDDSSWGQQDPDGMAVIDSPQSYLKPVNATQYVMTCWFRIPSDRTSPVVPVISQGADTSDGTPVQFAVELQRTGVWVFIDDRNNVGGTGRRAQWYFCSADINLFDGASHSLAVGWSNAGGAIDPIDNVHVWIDAVPKTVDGKSIRSSATVTRTDLPLRIGGHRGNTDVQFAAVPYSGVIDHVCIWSGVGLPLGSAVTANPWIERLHDAGRQAWAGQRLDERLDSILYGLGLESLVGAVDESGITTQQSYSPGQPLDLLQRIEDTEQGRIWCDREGLIRFSARGWAWTDTVSTIAQVVFSDDQSEWGDPGVFPFLVDGFRWGRDTRTSTNVAQVTSTHGRMQVATDEASVDRQGRRNAIHLSNLLHPTDAQSLAIAEWIVYSRKADTPSVSSISFRADSDPALAALAQQMEEGWLVEVHRRGRTVLGHISSITHDIGERWIVTLSLDSTRAGRSWFRADISPTDDPAHIAAF